MAVFAASNLFSQVTFTPPIVLGVPNPNNPIDFDCRGPYSLQMDDGIQDPDNLYRSDATAIWCNSETINLTESFETRFNIRFEDVTEADGIVFTIQREGLTARGGGGGYLGVANSWTSGISPSVNVEFDIWDNTATNGDISEDHVAISYNGNLASPVVAPSAISLVNNRWHLMQVNWDACSNTMTVRMDGDVISTLTDDLVTNVFGGDPDGIIFGFTSSTAMNNTPHDLCFISHVTSPCNCADIALPTVDLFSPLCALGDCCIGAEIYHSSVMPSSVVWDWGDGTTSFSNTHKYSADGDYVVTAIVQYQLLSSPAECCVKEVSQIARMRCRRGGGEFEFEPGAIAPKTTGDASLFPNPVPKGGVLTLTIPENTTANKFVVYDLTGKIIMEVTPKSKASITLNIPSDMQSGMYLIKADNAEIESLKFYVSE